MTSPLREPPSTFRAGENGFTIRKESADHFKVGRQQYLDGAQPGWGPIDIAYLDGSNHRWRLVGRDGQPLTDLAHLDWEAAIQAWH